jgi:DNA polymerase elongation subunit (family B)
MPKFGEYSIKRNQCLPLKLHRKMIFTVDQLYKTLFIDIETVSQYAEFSQVPEIIKPLWIRKAASIIKDFNTEDTLAVEESYKEKSAIYAEFGRIICISIGFLSKKGELRIKTISNDSEKLLLTELHDLLENHYFDTKQHFICGHNVKEFDIPYICRRMIINNLKLPSIFNIMSKRPWQTEFILDTMDLWRFGDYKSYTSLNLLCAILDVESPKTDLDGSKVGKAFWEENRLNDIMEYCAKDVQSTVFVLLKLTQIIQIEGITTEFIYE